MHTHQEIMKLKQEIKDLRKDIAKTPVEKSGLLVEILTSKENLLEEMIRQCN